MKRAFIFFAVFVTAAVFIFALVIGLNYSAYKTLFSNAEGMAEGSEFVENTYSLKDLTRFIGTQPDHVSIVSYNVQDPDSGIYYQPDRLRTLGFMGSIFLVAAYENQVEKGILDPGEIMDLNDITPYLLPEISQNAHDGAVERLTGDGGTFTLDEAVSVMIEFNDMAIYDLLWFRLGEDSIRAMVQRFSPGHTEVPLPFSGIYSVLNLPLNERKDATDYFTELEVMERDSLHGLMIRRAAMDVSSPSRVAERNEVYKNERLGLTFMQERDALSFFPQTTARELASVMNRIYTCDVLSEAVCRRVLDKLRWGIDSPTIERSFYDYGAIYDNRMGVLSGVDFGTSAYDGHTSVQAVLFDRLPVAFWHHMSANHMHEDYQQRLIWDPALYETTGEQIRLYRGEQSQNTFDPE